MQNEKWAAFNAGADSALEMVCGLFGDSERTAWNKPDIVDAIQELRKQLNIMADINYLDPEE